jgi:hypothetical protein
MSNSHLPEPAGFKRPASGNPPVSASAAESALIEEVLQQTSHVLTSRQPLAEADKRALEEVAARMRGKPLETVVAELILAMLRRHISGLPGFDELAPALSQRVARTLIDDPSAKPRLESLWNRLQGGAS